MNVCTKVALFLASFALLHSPNAWAAYGELKQPRLAMLNSFTEANYTKLNAVLDGKNIKRDIKYIRGHWLSGHSTLQYAGDTVALNLFIGALTKCPNVSVHIMFFRSVPGGLNCDWLVTHSGGSNKLVVRINLEATAIDLTKLYLPTIPAQKP